MKYGLIGHRLGHSFSKEIHEQIGKYEYELKELDANEFISFMEKKDFKAKLLEIKEKLLKGELTTSELNTETCKDCMVRKELTPKQKAERAIIVLAASVGAVLGILAYNFGWLG